MVDKKLAFVLSLQGKENAGHADYWSVSWGDLSGIRQGHYILFGRANNYEIIDDKYAISEHAYVTLGEKLTHATMIDIYRGQDD